MVSFFSKDLSIVPARAPGAFESEVRLQIFGSADVRSLRVVGRVLETSVQTSVELFLAGVEAKVGRPILTTARVQLGRRIEAIVQEAQKEASFFMESRIKVVAEKRGFGSSGGESVSGNGSVT